MILDSVTIGPLAAGGTYTYTYPTRQTKPDLVLPTTNTTISVTAMTTSSVSFENVGASSATAVFILYFYENDATRDSSNPQTLAVGWDGSNSSSGSGGIAINDPITSATAYRVLAGSSTSTLISATGLVYNETGANAGSDPWIGLGTAPGTSESADSESVRIRSPLAGPLNIVGTNTTCWIRMRSSASTSGMFVGLIATDIMLNNYDFGKIQLAFGGTVGWEMSGAGVWEPGADATYDIGTTLLRPRDLYGSRNILWSSDVDSTSIIGRVRLDSRTTDTANFSHFDQSGTSSYALRQSAGGATLINAASGQSISLSINTFNAWVVNSSGNFVAGTDNTYDIGASGATRPKDIYLAGALYATNGSSGSVRIGTNQHQISASTASILDLLAANSTDNRIRLRGRMAAGSTSNADITLDSINTRTNGNIVDITNNGTVKASWNFDGKHVAIAGNTQTTVGAAGGASALPATPTGYLRFFVGATEYVIPYYAQA